MASQIPMLPLPPATPGADRLNITPGFILAGHAIFTVSNGRGDHYTFKVRAWTPDGKDSPIHLAYLLTGPDRSSDWKFMGSVRETRRYRGDHNPVRPREWDEFLVFRLSPKSVVAGTPVNVLHWALRVISRGTMVHPSAVIRHMELCGRCGRPLTTPESIERGIGPDCWEIMQGK